MFFEVFMTLMKNVMIGMVMFGLLGTASIASAENATFTAPGTYTYDSTGAAISYTGTDPITGLQAEGENYQFFNGLNTVHSSVSEHLYVANGIGVTFTLPGRTFDLLSMRMTGKRAYNPRIRATLLYTIYAYHPGNPVPDAVPFTLVSTAGPVVKSFTADASRLQNIERAVISFDQWSGLTYFIDVNFTAH